MEVSGWGKKAGDGAICQEEQEKKGVVLVGM